MSLTARLTLFRALATSSKKLSQEWFVFPTESGNRDLIVGQSQDLPLFGFRITNPLVETPKTKVVLVSGNHSGEMGGNYVLEGLLEFLSSDDSRAKQMRNVADFYIYPMLDPLGRTEGYYRGNSQNPPERPQSILELRDIWQQRRL